jgi:hypothetical protein
MLLDSDVCDEFDASLVLDMRDRGTDTDAGATLYTPSASSLQPHTEGLTLGSAQPQQRLAELDRAGTPYYVVSDLASPAAQRHVDQLCRRALPAYLQRRGDSGDLFRHIPDSSPDAWHDNLFYYGVFGSGLHQDRWGTVAVNVHWPLSAEKQHKQHPLPSEQEAQSKKRARSKK